MQDHDRALSSAKPVSAKGLVQSIIPLDYGAGLTLPAKYYTPSGRLIQRDYSNGGFYDYYRAARRACSIRRTKPRRARPGRKAAPTRDALFTAAAASLDKRLSRAQATSHSFV
jgi:hypothetical protein